MKRLVLLLLCLLPSLAVAQSFPFHVDRDASGKLQRIYFQPALTIADESDELQDLKAAFIQEQRKQFSGVSQVLTPEGDVLTPDTPQNKRMYREAREALARDLFADDFDNPKVNQEFKKAKVRLKRISSLYLLADLQDPDALFMERDVGTAVSTILSGAKLVLGLPPLFSVFQVVLSEHVENLASRREFYQNQLLVLLDSKVGEQFSTEEKKFIRSSIFYSRLGLLSLKKKAFRHKWESAGTTALDSLYRSCKARNDRPTPEYGLCFEGDGKEILDLAVKHKNVAYRFDYPTAVRAHRQFLLLLKLGAALVPVPGVLQTLFDAWVDTKFVKQRRAEGYLYGNLKASGDDALAAHVIASSANPEL